MTTHRSLALALWIALSIVPLRAQEPSLASEFPWFVEEAPQVAFPDILIDTDWMAANLKRPGLRILDVRTSSLFEAGHLPGAVNDAGRSLAPEPGGVVVLYGSDQDLPSLGQAYLALAGQGWQDIKVLRVGFEAWSRAGLPREQGGSERDPSPRIAQPARGEAFATREEVLDAFATGGYEILDLRAGWGEGYAAPPEYSAGHIPHALPFDIRSLMPAEGWPDPEPARGVLLALGSRPSEHVDPNATFLLYGDGPDDPEVGLGFLLLRMMGVSTRVYAPGFKGWTEDARNPVVQIVEADAIPKGAILLDLREDWDYDESHILGAASLPERLFAERFDSIVREHWPKADPATTPVVLYCYGRDCIRSRNCAVRAAQKGYRRLLWLREGMAGWEAAESRRHEETGRRP